MDAKRTDRVKERSDTAKQTDRVKERSDTAKQTDRVKERRKVTTPEGPLSQLRWKGSRAPTP
ncbi:hypothetical protein AN643_02995 [Candidatus Epulonipiscioides saccharophilum]|nr:hypothetical protein AN643_02995 [Epulopiscium sp. SCG-B10WGA-EpuloB]